MSENFNSLFLYLEKEDIEVDKPEFSFQIQSHPNYPSVLAMADTLSFFNIQNGILRVDFSDIELLPNRFLALLTEEDNTNLPYLIERKGDKYFSTYDKKTTQISEAKLKNKWKSVVALVEKGEEENVQIQKKNKLVAMLPVVCLVLFGLTLFTFDVSLKSKLFFIFPIIGILFSIAALKDLFGTKSEFINSFCKITASTSCSSVTESTKWKVFDYVNLSDLSIVFFTSQLLTFFTFIFFNNLGEFFSIHHVILLLSVPVIFISVYYQKFVEKKWCPICLAIIGIIISELFYLQFSSEISYNTITFQSLVVIGFIFSVTVFAWAVLKSVLTKLKELKEFQITGNRFMRNYEIFKNTLVSKERFDLPDSPIILGNKDAKTEIAIITSPYCGHCKNAHELLERILASSRNDIKIKIIFNAEMSTSDEDRKSLFRGLMSIYQEQGEAPFLKALHYWFQNKDMEDWIQVYGVATYDAEKIDAVYDAQNKWCVEKGLYLTPTIFMNGFKYPKTYVRENIEHFVYELLEDNF